MKFYTNVFKYGNQLYYRGYDDGIRIHKKVHFRPTLYDRTNEKTPFKSIYGHGVAPRKFDSMKDAKEYVDMYDGIDNIEIYGNQDYLAQYIQEEWPDNILYDEKFLNVVSMDIEVYSKDGFPDPDFADKVIDSVTLRSSKSDTVFLWSLYDYDPLKTELDIDPKNILHVKCETETDLLRKILKWWNLEQYTPDIVTGWYLKEFDIPYFINRCKKILDENEYKEMSPWGIVFDRTRNVMGREVKTYSIKGVSQIDLLDVFKKPWHSYGPQESYKLDHISNVVLGEKKLDYSEHAGLYDLADRNPQKYQDYNIKDVLLVERIAEKTNLMSIVIAMAYDAGVQFEDALGTIRLWDTLIYRELMKDNIIVQPEKRRPKAKFEGAYVKDPIPGRYDWVMSFDLASLYPNIMIQWNMSPETILGVSDTNKTLEDYLAGFKPSLNDAQAVNGARFDTSVQGHVPKILSAIYGQRKAIQNEMREYKKKYNENGNISDKEMAEVLHTQQMAKKIQINSCYGAFGNENFRHYDLRIAEAITTTGKFVTKTAEKTINWFIEDLTGDPGPHVVYADTDSCYFTVKSVLEKYNLLGRGKEFIIDFLDGFGKSVVKRHLDEAFSELNTRLNCFVSRMNMKRELIMERAFWTVKKRYAGTVWDDEGIRYTEPKLKVTGLEAVRSTTPAFVRDKLKEFYTIVLTSDEAGAQTYISDYKKEFFALPVEDIAKNTGVSDIEKHMEGDGWKKGAPGHVRAAISYNKEIRKRGIDNIYPPITSGDNIKIIALKTPNPTELDKIAFINNLPEELNLHKYVDRSDQFNRVFIRSVEPVMASLGWDVEERISVESFFA